MDWVLSLANTLGKTGMSVKYESWLCNFGDFVIFVTQNNNHYLYGLGLEFGQHPGSNGDEREVRIMVMQF